MGEPQAGSAEFRLDILSGYHRDTHISVLRAMYT